jgi:hypothetical protein
VNCSHASLLSLRAFASSMACQLSNVAVTTCVAGRVPANTAVQSVTWSPFMASAWNRVSKALTMAAGSLT